jgi:membrane-associated protease RseP (regulator of RpoE activity)
MVVISAGVVMNLILAGVLFVVAFSVGMREVAPVVGVVQPGSAAEKAGFAPGDVIERAGGWDVSTFSHVMLESAMAEKNEPMEVVVRRHASGERATLKPVPEVGPGGLLQLGLGPAPSNQLFASTDLLSDQDRERYRAMLVRGGLGTLEPGTALVRLNGADVSAAGAIDLELALERSGGQPVAAVFSGPQGEREVQLTPRAVFERAASESPTTQPFAVEHVLGLAPAMMVADVSPEGEKAGLLAGDVFARIGGIEWPNVVEGIAAIRAASGSTIELVVQREGGEVTLGLSDDGSGLAEGWQQRPGQSRAFAGLGEHPFPRGALGGDVGAFRGRLFVRLGTKLVDKGLGLIGTEAEFLGKLAQVIEQGLGALPEPLEVCILEFARCQGRLDLLHIEADGLDTLARSLLLCRNRDAGLGLGLGLGLGRGLGRGCCGGRLWRRLGAGIAADHRGGEQDHDAEGEGSQRQHAAPLCRGNPLADVEQGWSCHQICHPSS